MVEIWCNGTIHYTRPSMDDKDVQECLALIKWHELLSGGISSYEVREILPSTAFTGQEPAVAVESQVARGSCQ